MKKTRPKIYRRLNLSLQLMSAKIGWREMPAAIFGVLISGVKRENGNEGGLL